MRLAIITGFGLLMLSTLAFGQGSGEKEGLLPGFRQETSVQERSQERYFDSRLSKQNQRDWMKRLTARPHHLGSLADKENAEFIAGLFRSWGYETQIETFEVLFPTPKTRLLELTAPGKHRAKLLEPVLKEDNTSGVGEQLPTYNAYSCDGDVTGPVVFVNYGIPKDYEQLEAQGVDVKGKIVLVKYGQAFRGIKPKVAFEHGAIGCLIYSDPRDDGYFQGDVYPKGPFRNENGAQRGSVMDLSVAAGDPLTPGIGATRDARRLAFKDVQVFTKIPTLPISYADALPILQSLTGPVALESWRGALPLTYHLGPGPATVHLKLEFNWNMVPANDVIARLPGSSLPNEWVLRGNHYDAWVFGAEDPISGTVALMEEARSVGELARSGSRPQRTIVYTVWDGEEPGLIGSTEWAETHEVELKNKVVLYLNSDSNGRGYLNAGGSHTLEPFVKAVAQDVPDPEKKMSVGARQRALALISGSPEAKKEAQEGAFHLNALGSGSDFSPFLQHLGIASLDIGYGGESAGGSYHSIYDSFDYYTHFGDPDFRYGIALAQTAGRIILRAANADVLPLQFTPLADTVGKYVGEIIKLTDDTRNETETKNKQISDGTLAATFDPTKTDVLPSPKEPVPYLNFAPMQNALTKLQQSAKAYDAAYKLLMNGAKPLSNAQRQELDTALMQTERAMLRNEGLPRRPWYRHQIYAPGYYTGYGVKTLPAVREAIEQRNWKEASEQIEVVARTLLNVADAIDHATATAQNASK